LIGLATWFPTFAWFACCTYGESSIMTQRISFSVLVICIVTLTGCGKSKSVTSIPATTPSESSSTDATAASSAEVAEEVLLEPFDPPKLEELEAAVTWVDQRVVDPLELRRETEADLKPLVSVDEALKLRNDGAEANKKILSSLGRLPDNDGQVNYDATLVRHLNGDAKSTNPLMSSSVSESEVNGLTGIGVFSFDWEMKPLALAAVAVSWQTSSDGMYDKVVLRDDLTWSDGKPITAHDVVFSFQTIMNPKVPVPAVRSGTDELRWVEAYDNQTLIYFHKKPSPTNIWNINFPVIPKHIYEKSVQEDPTMANSEYHIKLEQNPVCGGPYTISSRIQGQEVVLQRRDDWFKKDGKLVRPLQHFKEIRCRVIEDPNTALLALRAGEIEETLLNPEQWITEQTNNDEFYAKNTKVTGTEWVSFHFVWNCETPYFSDKRVRRAMSFAFDHKEMLDKLFYGLYEPAMGPFHPTAWMAPKSGLKPYTQDLDKAEELLDAAGWEDSDGDGIRDKVVDGKKINFEFTLLCSTTPNSLKVSELMKQNLDQIGVVCNVKPTEFTVLQQLEIEHKFHAAMGGWGTGTDPDTSINIFGTGENRNFGRYSNAEVDKLFQEGRKEFDPVKRAAIYAKIHELLYEDQTFTWLFWRNSFYGFNKSIRGYKFSPRGPYSYGPGLDALWKEVP
jgi:peptide/nickel transport system substrate-binding protein